jgi:hypothetical protein
MCLDPELKLLSTSRLRELSTMENNVSLYFLKKEDEDFPGGSILEMKKNRGIRLVEDNLQRSELDSVDEISRASRDCKHKDPPSKCPDLCRVVFTAI